MSKEIPGFDFATWLIELAAFVGSINLVVR